MALGRISGLMLKADLERQGVDLSIDTDLLYIDVANNRIGVNTATPAQALDVVGSAKISALTSTRIPYATTGGLIVDSANLTFDGTNLRVGGVIVTVGGAALTDGDKGDITVSATGATWTIDAGVVTLAKQAALAANSVIGNATGSLATPAAVTLSSTSGVSTLVFRDASGNTQTSNARQGYTTTATAGATTTFTVASTYLQFFTGTLAQTVVLPVTSTLVLGHQYYIRNNSTGLLTINSSGGNLIRILGPGTRAMVTCILTSGTTAASWSAMYLGINIVDGKVLTINNNLTLSGTDGNSLAINSVGASISGVNTGDQTITLTSDVTGSGTGSFATTIAAGAVTLAKMANLAANSIIGNNTGAGATPIALTVAQVKTLLAYTPADIGAATTAQANATHTGEVTGATALTIATSAVTNAKLANMNGNTVKVNNAGSAGVPSDLQMTTNTVLGRQGGNLISAQVATGQIADNAITLGKMATLSANSIIGNNTGSPATPIALTAAQTKTLLLIVAADVSDFVDAVRLAPGYATTVTAAGTTTLTASSADTQVFTGTTTQTVVLPDVTTLSLGRTFRIVNESTGNITVQSSGLNAFTGPIASKMTFTYTCVLTTGTTTASWVLRTGGADGRSGTGNAVFSNSATLIDPTFIGLVSLPAGSTASPSARLPHGVAPTTPTDGDVWTTTAGFFARINGATVDLALGTNLGYTPSTRILTSDTGSDVTLPLVTSTDAGLAPASGGGTTAFLRADGTWATPSGGAASLIIQDEGSTLTTSPTKLNFVGAGVTVTKPIADEILVTITSGGGGGLVDGDYGDITVGGSGTTMTIDAGTVTLAKQAVLAANSIIGNNTGSPATPIALTAAQTKTLLAIVASDVSDFTTAVRAVGGYTTTATAAGTTTLTASSSDVQIFTGTLTQSVVLPVTSTLSLGRTFKIVNRSTVTIDVASSGLNTISGAVQSGSTEEFICVLTSGTTAASWVPRITGNQTRTGSGNLVYSATPTISNAQFSGTSVMAAGTTGAASLRVPHGVAPLSPQNGDMWTTTAGVFTRLNGTTVDLTATGVGGSRGTATLNFGVTSGSSYTELVVTGQAGILTGSNIRVWIQADSTADHNEYEHTRILAGRVNLAAADVSAGTGFTIIAESELRLTGQVKCRWEWS